MAQTAQLPAIDFLYSDDFLFVVNKAACAHSCANPRSVNPSIAAALIARWPALAGVGESESDGGLVQRLDFQTSGCLLGARVRDVWLALREQLSAKSVGKSYLVLLEGKFEHAGIFESWLGSPNRRAKKVRVYKQEPKPKERALFGRTTFELIKFYPDKEVSLVRAYAPLARRHQIRAHSAALGHPLVGDELYGASRTLSGLFSETVQALPEFFLHAEQISFQHPREKKLICVSAAAPEFIALLD